MQRNDRSLAIGFNCFNTFFDPFVDILENTLILLPYLSLYVRLQLTTLGLSSGKKQKNLPSIT